MKRLLIFCNDYDYFMAHRYDLFAHLPQQGIRIQAYCGHAPRIAGHRLAFPIGVYACDRYRFRPFLDVWLFVQMLILLVRHRPDVVHTITLKPNLFGGLAVRLYNLLSRRRCRLVMMTPGLGRIFAGRDVGGPGSLHRRLVAAGLRSALRSPGARAAFENDADNRFWTAQGIVNEDRSHVIQGTGVDPAIFRAPDSRPPAPPLRVLFASRLLKSKGVETVVDLAAEAEARGWPMQFLVAGQADNRDADSVDLSQQVLPRTLEYTGFCDDMAKLLAGVHVVLLPTLYAEGLPRILLEAAATGCALVASDIPGCRRIVEDGVNGYVLPLHAGKVCFDAAIAAMNELADDPALCSTMGTAARASFRKGKFDIDSVRRDLASLLFDDNWRNCDNSKIGDPADGG